MNKASKNVFTRFLSAMLAVIMVFGLFPANQFVARAEAATGGEPSDTITPSGSIEMEGQYDSGYGLGRPYVHRFAMETGPAGVIDAFCLNHSDHLGHACEGKKWSNKRPYDPGKATPFVVWYYWHVYEQKDWDNSTINVVNAWVQAMIWLRQASSMAPMRKLPKLAGQSAIMSVKAFGGKRLRTQIRQSMAKPFCSTS